MMLDQQKTAQEWLKIRRDIMDRVFGYRECQGKLLRHQAEAIACRRRLELEREKLTDVQTMDIEGRAIEAEARAKYCEQKMEHYHMEILALRAVIEGQDHGIH